MIVKQKLQPSKKRILKIASQVSK